MKFLNKAATSINIILTTAILISPLLLFSSSLLVACSPSPEAETETAAVVVVVVTPTAAAADKVAAQATIASEPPQFPKTAVSCGVTRPFYMGFTRPHYVKSAYSKLFHLKYYYDSEPGIIARVICFRTAGIFVENTGDKPMSIPFATIADMARNIIYSSCNRKKGDPSGYVNGEQTDTRDNFVVIVAYSKCRKPHKGTSIRPVAGLDSYGKAIGPS